MSGPVRRRDPHAGWTEEPAVDPHAGWSEEPAQPAPWDDTAQLSPETAAAARSGILQGGSLGFGDEIGAGVQAAAQHLSRSALNPDGSEMSAADVYRQARSGNRAEEGRIRAKAPGAYLGGELAGSLALPIPGSSVVRGAKGAWKAGATALQGAGIGAVAGAGSSEASDLGGVAKDAGRGAAWGGGLGAAFGAGSLLMQKLQEKAAAGIKAAEAEQLFERLKDIAKDVKSKTGSMGQLAADVLQSRRVAEEAAAKLENTHPELAKKLREAADNPEALARLAKAAENYLPRLDRGLEDFATREAELAAAKARDPALEAAQELEHPIRDVWLPRVKTLLNRGVPIYIGSQIGSMAGSPMAGTVAGGIASAVTGRAGTILANAVKAPATKKLAGKLVLGALGGGEDALAAKLGQGVTRSSEVVAPMETRPSIDIRFDPATGLALTDEEQAEQERQLRKRALSSMAGGD